MKFIRKLIGFVLLIAVAWAAVSPASFDLIWSMVAPLLLWAGVLIVVAAHCKPKENQIRTQLCLPVVASRAPLVSPA